MKNRTYTQLCMELKTLIMEQGKYQERACIEGETKELLDRIVDLQRKIDEKRTVLQILYGEIVESIEAYYQQDSAEYNVLLSRFGCQMDWDEIAYRIYGSKNEELAKMVFESVDWERPELMEWLREHTGVDGYEETF